MDASDLIVIARKRASLSQRELAHRLDCPQATVARWEAGAREPSFAAVQRVLRACGCQQPVDLASYDDSDVPLSHLQLSLTPLQRLSSMAREDAGTLTRALRAIAASPARLIILDEAAGALQGSPLLIQDALVVAVAHPDDRACAETELAGEPVRLVDRPAGTHGYRDLARSAARIALDPAHTLTVACIQDLLRIALSDPDAHRQAIALAATLRAAHTHTGTPAKLTDRQARAAAERWLARQTAVHTTA
jgi:transcriptional regulator with XRE-family HTH domain